VGDLSGRRDEGRLRRGRGCVVAPGGGVFGSGGGGEGVRAVRLRSRGRRGRGLLQRLRRGRSLAVEARLRRRGGRVCKSIKRGARSEARQRRSERRAAQASRKAARLGRTVGGGEAEIVARGRRRRRRGRGHGAWAARGCALRERSARGMETRKRARREGLPAVHRPARAEGGEARRRAAGGAQAPEGH
jgi:hypothetical protein